MRWLQLLVIGACAVLPAAQAAWLTQTKYRRPNCLSQMGNKELAACPLSSVAAYELRRDTASTTSNGFSSCTSFCGSSKDNVCINTPFSSSQLSVKYMCSGGTYGGTQLTDEQSKALAGSFAVLLIFGVLAWACICGGMWMCIRNHSRRGATPRGEAYLVSVLLCFCASPCFMWLPFVFDGCYTNNGGAAVGHGGYGGTTTTTTTQQDEFGMQPTRAQAMPVQQVMHVQAVAVQVQPAGYGAAGAASGGGAPVYDYNKPVMATAVAMPMP